MEGGGMGGDMQGGMGGGMPAAPMGRPTGVTILAVLAAIGGVLGLLAGLAIIGLGGLAGASGAAAVGGTALIAGLIILVVAVVELALAYGFWTLKPWAWQVGIILMVVQIVIAVLGVVRIFFSSDVVSAVIQVVIAGVIIYYLNLPDIRRAFGAPEKGWPLIGGY